MSVRSLRAGLRRLFRRDAADRDLSDEISHYLDLAVEEHMRRGLSRADAERLARVEFGGVEAAKERVRSSGWEAVADALWQDVRYCLRGLRRNPLFTSAAIATLALGIGVNTAMFSVVNTVMLRPLPYDDSGRLLYLFTHDIKRALPFEGTASSTIADWQRDTTAFEGVAFFSGGRAVMGGRDTRERVRNGFTSANLFPLLGVSPLRGRLLTPEDERTAAPVAVISHALWQRRFSLDPDIVGKPLPLDDWQGRAGSDVLTIVGVMPDGFYFPDRETHLWVPATTYWRWELESVERYAAWARRWTAVARLRAGVSLDDARRDLARVSSQLATAYATDYPDFPGFAINALTMLDRVTGAPVQRTLWLLMGAVALVLLVACANVGNLLLARGAARQHEIAVRRALGASRTRLIRQLLVESVVLALIGGAVGLAFAAGVTRVLAASAAIRLPRIGEIAIDVNVLIFALVAATISGVLFGLVPALRVTAPARPHIGRARGVFVAVECGVAVLLLVGAGLLLRSLARVHSVDVGFDASNVLMMRLEFPRQLPPFDALLSRVAELPGVESVGFVDDMFISGQGNESVVFPGRDNAAFEAAELAEALATPGFFSTMRIPLRLGRYLSDADAHIKARARTTVLPSELSLGEKARRAIAEPVVVNETFVRHFRLAEPVGERFCVDPTDKTYCYEIVGVIGDMLRKGPERQAIAEYYRLLLPSPSGRADLVVRLRGAALATAGPISTIVRETIPGALVPSVNTADAAFGEFTAQRNLQTWLLSLFAALTVVLAAVGVYGIVHYSVSQRTREIGVRIAIGARPRDVMSLVIAGGMRLPLVGVAIGLVGALGLTRVMASLLFEVDPTDLPAFALSAATLALVALLACVAPARRAARLDAVKALRLE